MEKNSKHCHKTCGYNITNGSKHIKVDQKTTFHSLFWKSISFVFKTEWIGLTLNWFECC
jgi:hypothetical protein